MHPAPPALDCDEPLETRRIEAFLVRAVKTLRKRGVVVALSGGIDSSVCAALCARALGPERVFGLLLPERESSDSSRELGELLARHLGISFEVVDITSALDALGCYQVRDAAIASAVPGFGPGWRQKIVIEGGSAGRFNHFRLIARSPSGEQHDTRLGLREYLSIVAATNYKQRVRKTVEYFHADRLNFAVIGTPNRLEYDQGFFVKHGDGAADIKPIAHLYKSQVYALARHLQLPERICSTTPTTDTYTLPQGQDEFFFALPYAQMDLALWAHDHSVPPEQAAVWLGLDLQTTRHVYKDIESKRSAAEYLHARPMTLFHSGTHDAAARDTAASPGGAQVLALRNS